MGKATLEFDLNDLDDRMGHLRAVKSTDMACAIFQICYNTKKELEYSIEAKEEKGEEVTAYDAVHMTMEKIHEIFNEYGINIDELLN
jgi:hypothetical protein